MKEKNVIKPEEILYMSGLFIYIMCMMVYLTVPGKQIFESGSMLIILKLLRYSSYLLTSMGLFYQNIKRRYIIGAAFIFVLLIFNVVASNEKITFFFFLFIMFSYQIGTDKVLMSALSAQLCIVLVTVALCKLGIISDYIFLEGGRTRHSLGFQWTTTPAIIYFFIVLEIIYLRKNKMRIVEYVALFLGHSFFYMATRTRMTYAIGCLVLIVFFLYNHSRVIKGIIEKFNLLFICFPCMAGVVSIAMHFFYNKNVSVWVKLNSFLNNRLMLGKNGFEKYGVTLWGQSIEWIGNSYDTLKGEYNYVDCSYVQILLQQGVIFLLIVLAIYTIIIYEAIKRGDYYLCGICIFILIYSITEPRLFDLSFNPFPLCLGGLLPMQRRLKKRGKRYGKNTCCCGDL